MKFLNYLDQKYLHSYNFLFNFKKSIHQYLVYKNIIKLFLYYFLLTGVLRFTPCFSLVLWCNNIDWVYKLQYYYQNRTLKHYNYKDYL